MSKGVKKKALTYLRQKGKDTKQSLGLSFPVNVVVFTCKEIIIIANKNGLTYKLNKPI